MRDRVRESRDDRADVVSDTDETKGRGAARRRRRGERPHLEHAVPDPPAGPVDGRRDEPLDLLLPIPDSLRALLHFPLPLAALARATIVVVGDRRADEERVCWSGGGRREGGGGGRGG